MHVCEKIVPSNKQLEGRDLRSFVIRFVLMVRFEIFESYALSIVIRKETISGG